MNRGSLLVVVALSGVGCSKGANPLATSAGTDPAAIKAVQAQLSQVKLALNDLDVAFSGARPGDRDALRKVEAAGGKLEIKRAVYRAVAAIDDDQAPAQVVEVFAGATAVRMMLDSYVKSAVADVRAPGTPTYAVVTSGPGNRTPDAPFGVKLVEVGRPFCDGKLATADTCAPGQDSSGIAYRAEPGAIWTKIDVAAPGPPIELGRLVPLLPTGVLDGLMKGNEQTASAVLARKRGDEIAKRAHELLDVANRAESSLQSVAARN